MGQFVWPCQGWVSSQFGPRPAPKPGASTYHRGIDIAAGYGTSIVAARSGTVRTVAYSSARGNYCIIQHTGGYSTLYQHCSSISVRAGQTVSAGQVIAKVGSTGISTGPHLHFEVQKNGTPVNPLSYVRPSDTLANYTGGDIANNGTGGLGPTTDAADSAADAIHVPQVEAIWTKYEGDTPNKEPDTYSYTWQSLDTGKVLDITDRVGSPSLLDDSDSLSLELSFEIVQATGEKYLQPLAMACGDLVAVVNMASQECIFLGQIQTVSGSYRDSMAITCLDEGRLLSANDVILQFNNIPAKDAISQIAAKVGIPTLNCPNLISSVYGIEKGSAADLIQKILETVTSENKVPYFPRMMGHTLVIRSFAKDPMQFWCRQQENLAAFDVLAEPGDPQVSWDITDLRNQVIVYSEMDNTISIQGTAEDSDSIKRYGRRAALETYSDQDSVSAGAKAKNALAEKNVVKETFSLTTYGSDRILAGVRLKIDMPEAKGEYWVTSVTHDLAIPHMVTMTLRRAT